MGSVPAHTHARELYGRPEWNASIEEIWDQRWLGVLLNGSLGSLDRSFFYLFGGGQIYADCLKDVMRQLCLWGLSMMDDMMVHSFPA